MKHYELLINAKDIIGHINPEIYGHFSEHLGRCIYNGIYVGENSSVPNIKGIRADMIEALRNIKIPVLHSPGGCFAEEYHWKDGIGSKESRKKIINTNWGGVTEDNSFGTHEFMSLRINRLRALYKWKCGKWYSSGIIRMDRVYDLLCQFPHDRIKKRKRERGTMESKIFGNWK